MKKFRRQGWVGVVMSLLVLFPMNNAAFASTRDENVKAIETALQDDEIREGLSAQGVTDEMVMESIGSMSDEDVQLLADASSPESSSSSGDNDDNGGSFWKTFLIAWLVTAALLTIGVFYLFGVI